MAEMVRSLTAAALAVHLVLGCCEHHALACLEEGHSQHHAAPATALDAAHDCHGECPDGRSGGPHRGAHECHGAPCSFVRPSHETTAASLLMLGQPHFVLMAAGPPASAAASFGSWRQFLPTGPLPLPVRLHLAHQVLLI